MYAYNSFNRYLNMKKKLSKFAWPWKYQSCGSRIIHYPLGEHRIISIQDSDNISSVCYYLLLGAIT